MPEGTPEEQLPDQVIKDGHRDAQMILAAIPDDWNAQRIIIALTCAEALIEMAVAKMQEVERPYA